MNESVYQSMFSDETDLIPLQSNQVRSQAFLKAISFEWQADNKHVKEVKNPRLILASKYWYNSWIRGD